MAKSITIFVDNELYEEIKAIAKAQGMSMNEFVNEAIKKWLQRKIRNLQ